MNIDINFSETYQLKIIEPDLTKFTFKSPVTNGTAVTITVKIRTAHNPFISEFLNLAFGPEQNGEIDDFAAIRHNNPSKALTTVLYAGLIYLKANPDAFLGVDGSDFRRAYFYFRIIQRNYNYLHKYFKLFGVKYYIRVLRGKDKNDVLQIDPEELTYMPYSIEYKPLTKHTSLFNYFIFYLK
jgi:hypothetical protein